MILDVGSRARLGAEAGTLACAVLSMAPEAIGGPLSEFTVMALGGALDIVGDPARAPLRLAGHQAAYSGGLAVLAGLLAARCGGAGLRGRRSG